MVALSLIVFTGHLSQMLGSEVDSQAQARSKAEDEQWRRTAAVQAVAAPKALSKNYTVPASRLRRPL